ncbi:hypothetical protein CNYM01_00382 [Colletotrichum nymphaeae SA-01]|uniref:Clr5 domain-containing protein n=1 Tax=Colletotrichum nymphaeae SA-01 TaxID=1460502 RepID=A0A135RPF5_9PEZI|nr:hypothetical protein CNYM01_00382 [Colletotrichum nymphaeae SA-01]
MALSFVLAALKTIHNFHASKAQLEWKLKEWQMFKNMTAQQWKCVDVRIRERLSRGKKTSLYLSGIPLRPATVEKARARHCHTSVVEKFKPQSPVVAVSATVERASSLIQRSPLGYANSDALEVMIFLLSNGFYNYVDDEPYKRDMVNEAISTMFRDITAWKLLVSRPLKTLPISLQALLCQLFEKAVLASDLATIESLALAGIDVNLPLVGLPIPAPLRFRRYCQKALHWAIYTLNMAMVELLIKLGACSHSVDLDVLRVNCMPTLRPARVVCEPSLETMTRWVLSVYRYEEDDEIASRVFLNELGLRTHTSATELVLEFFESKFKSATSLAQLLVTCVKTRSKFVYEWALKHRGCLNYTNYVGESVLGAAASRNNYPLCERLLELGAILNPIIKFGSLVFATPLQCAAASADPRLIKLLLDHGADINFCLPFAGDYAEGPRRYRERQVITGDFLRDIITVGQLGRTSLQAALSCGSEENAMFLLSCGARLFGEELAISMRTRLASATAQILALGASLATPSLSDELSPLEAAIVIQDSLLALHIIGSMDADMFSMRAVFAAVYMSDYTFDWILFHKLLELSKNAQSPTSEHHWLGLAMCLAMRLGIDDVADEILMTGLCPPQMAYRDFGYKMFKPFYRPPEVSLQLYEELYLEAINEDTQQGEKHRPATFHALLSSPNCVTRLVQSGHRFNIDCSGVVENPHALAILPCLQRNGATLDRLVLTRAILVKSTAIVDWYLSSGIGVNTVHRHVSERSWGTPLRAAASVGDINLVETLVSMGADVNEDYRDFRCNPPLTAAAMMGFFGVVKRLLELGADPNIPGGTRFTRTALEAASENGRLDIVQLLLDSGVSTEGTGRLHYVRAVVLARKWGRPAVERLLRSFRSWYQADHELFDETYNMSDDCFEGLGGDEDDCSESGEFQDNLEPQEQNLYYDVGAEIIMTAASGPSREEANSDGLALPSKTAMLIKDSEDSEDSKAKYLDTSSRGGTQNLQGITGTGCSEVNGTVCRVDTCSLHDDQYREGNSDDWMEKYIRFPSEAPSI